MEIKLKLNGRAITASVDCDTILLDFLRDQGCLSVKRGCDTSNCGLCTVLMDGTPVLSCSMLAARADGDTEDHKLFVVDFDGKPEDLFPHLAKAVRLYLRQGEQVEMRKADITLLRIAEQAAKPIYEKK